MIKDFVQNGNWIYSPNKTSLHFYYNNIRVMGLQMYGSRNKKHKENKTYPNTYFGLQFRIICGKIKANYVTDV
jgi:hypothetical protein